MNFLTENQIVTEIKKLLKNANEVLFAVSFWGKGALDELRINNWKGKNPLKIVCNLESGATNPSEIEKMLSSTSKKTIDVRSNEKLHAKVYWTDKGCIITSANASANGLSYEGKEELTGWLEAGYMVTDKEELAEIKKWFLKSVWKEENKITTKMLKDARELWNKKRTSRPMEKLDENISLLEFGYKFPEKIKDKILFTTYEQEEPSKKAHETFEKFGFPDSYCFYENWELPSGKVVLDVSYEKNKKPEFDALWLVHTVSKINKKHSITIIEEITSFQGCKKINKLDKKKFEDMAQNCIKDYRKKDKDTNDIVMDFVDFLEYQA